MQKSQQTTRKQTVQPNNQDTQDAEVPVQPEPIRSESLSGSSMYRSLQPLSSEAAILKEAESNKPKPRPVAPLPEHHVGDVGGELFEAHLNAHPVPMYDSTTPLPVEQRVFEPASPAKQAFHPKKLIGIFVIILFSIGGFAAFYVINVASFTVSEGDLVEQKADFTTYSRPKQWVQLDRGFGDGRSDDGKSSSLVSVTVSPVEPALINPSDRMLKELRELVKNTVTEQRFVETMQKSDKPCTAPPKVQIDASLASVGSLEGLSQFNVSCERQDGKFTLKMRLYLGTTDGRVRTIVVGSTDSLWKQNGAVYEKILDSVKISEQGLI